MNAKPIWSGLIGQDAVVEVLSAAVDDAANLVAGEPGPAMTHSWLLTGPPGSGRSTAATSFAAALVCPEQGCGACRACRTAAGNGHADVMVIRPEGLTYGVDETRELISQAVLSPVDGHWRVMVVEDADRLTQQASNALLKSIEEPPPHTVWLLCAPSIEDVLPTIASRTRHVHLRTPPAEDVAALLEERYGVDRAMATFAARASQGHIGRARALATDEHARLRRQEILRIPLELHDLPACFVCAANLIGAATEDAAAITSVLDEAEKEQLQASFGADQDSRLKGQAKRSMDAAAKRLTEAQRLRSTRTVRDQIDRALLDLMGLYRDVLVLQQGADIALINEEMRPQIAQLAASTSLEDTVRRVDAIEHTRKALGSNAAPLVLLEALMVNLKDPRLRQAVLSG